MPCEPMTRDPGERYPVMLCVHCRHPGDQHVLGGACRLCPDCPGWGEQQGAQGYWSDRMTDDLLAAPDPEATAAPLTCGSCRNSPATHLVVADLGIGGRKTVRGEQLNCKACADFALRHAGAGDRLHLYRLVPEETS